MEHSLRTKCHILDHKTNLKKSKGIKVIHIMFSDHNGIKLELNKIKKMGKISEQLEIKQHTFKQFVGQKGNLTGNFKIYTEWHEHAHQL